MTRASSWSGESGPRGRRRSYSQRMAAGRDERAFVRAAQRGSASGIEALFRLHWPGAYRAAYLVVHDSGAAEDIAQESFLAAVRNLDRFDRRRPFGPWLHRIVVNRAIDWTRARTLRGEAELHEAFAAPEQAALARRIAARRARRPPTRASSRDRPSSSARVHARRDLRAARPPARDGQLAPPPRTRLVEGNGVKRELEQIEIPNEHEARVRSLAVVREAFAEREPQPRRRSWKPLAAIAIALVVVAGLLSPPGRAVLDDIREVVGVEKAQPALFSLPAPGRLLVDCRLRRLGRRAGRLEAASRQLSRGLVVSVRPLRRRVACERAGRAHPARRCALVGRPAERPLPALGRHGDGHAHRLSLSRGSCASSAATARVTG